MDGIGLPSDWLNSLFGDDDPFLSERPGLLSFEGSNVNDIDPATPPHIKEDHSYSLNYDTTSSVSSPDITNDDDDFEHDIDLNSLAPAFTIDHTDFNPTDHKPYTQTLTINTTAPTALSNGAGGTIVFPGFQLSPEQVSIVTEPLGIKQEPLDIDVETCMELDTEKLLNGLPPTPPSSNTSDSESSVHSPKPKSQTVVMTTMSSSLTAANHSPSRNISKQVTSIHQSPKQHQQHFLHQQQQQHQHQQQQHHHHQLNSQSSPVFSKIPTSGVLILTDEEKRTLISEGYPMPAKLPLTKYEEKCLKKVRRKIKNKISAQESRRKKKEYVDCLEKRVEQYSSENTDLRKKVDTLENNNRTLIQQLKRLQSLVSKVPKASATQTGTCLMGMWSTPLPSTVQTTVSNAAHLPQVASAGPQYGPHIVRPRMKNHNPYTTRAVKSRILLSLTDDGDQEGLYRYPDRALRSFHDAPEPSTVSEPHIGSRPGDRWIEGRSHLGDDRLYGPGEGSMAPEMARSILSDTSAPLKLVGDIIVGSIHDIDLATFHSTVAMEMTQQQQHDDVSRNITKVEMQRKPKLPL